LSRQRVGGGVARATRLLRGWPRAGKASYFVTHAEPLDTGVMTPSPPADAAALPAPTPAEAAAWLADAPAPLACVDATGTLRWANAAGVSLLGPLAAGQPLADALQLDATARQALQQLLAEGGAAELATGCTCGTLATSARATAGGDWLLAFTSIAPQEALRARAERAEELLDMARQMGRLGVWERNVRTGAGRWDREIFRMRGVVGEGGDAPDFDTTLNLTLGPTGPGSPPRSSSRSRSRATIRTASASSATTAACASCIRTGG
jgi:hypothetical protein